MNVVLICQLIAMMIFQLSKIKCYMLHNHGVVFNPIPDGKSKVFFIDTQRFDIPSYTPFNQNGVPVIIGVTIGKSRYYVIYERENTFTFFDPWLNKITEIDTKPWPELTNPVPFYEDALLAFNDYSTSKSSESGKIRLLTSLKVQTPGKFLPVNSDTEEISFTQVTNLKSWKYIHGFQFDVFTYILGIRTLAGDEGINHLFLIRMCQGGSVQSYTDMVLKKCPKDKCRYLTATYQVSYSGTNNPTPLLIISYADTSNGYIDLYSMRDLDKELDKVRQDCFEVRGIGLSPLKAVVSGKSIACQQEPFIDWVSDCSNSTGGKNLYPTGQKTVSTRASKTFSGRPIRSIVAVPVDYPLYTVFLFIITDKAVTRCFILEQRDITINCDKEDTKLNFTESDYHLNPSVDIDSGRLWFWPRESDKNPASLDIMDCGLFYNCSHCEKYGPRLGCRWSNNQCIQERSSDPARENVCFRVKRFEPEVVKKYKEVLHVTIETSGYEMEKNDLCEVKIGSQLCRVFSVYRTTIRCAIRRPKKSRGYVGIYFKYRGYDHASWILARSNKDLDIQVDHWDESPGNSRKSLSIIVIVFFVLLGLALAVGFVAYLQKEKHKHDFEDAYETIIKKRLPSVSDSSRSKIKSTVEKKKIRGKSRSKPGPT